MSMTHIFEALELVLVVDKVSLTHWSILLSERYPCLYPGDSFCISMVVLILVIALLTLLKVPIKVCLSLLSMIIFEIMELSMVKAAFKRSEILRTLVAVIRGMHTLCGIIMAFVFII